MASFGRNPRLTPERLADQLQSLLDATDRSADPIHHELSVAIGDPDLDLIRAKALELLDDHVATGEHSYFGSEQQPQIRALIRVLRLYSSPHDGG